MQSLEDLSKEQLIFALVKLQERIDELEKTQKDSEQVAAELVQAKAMFEGLFEFAPDAILVINSKGKIVQANQQAERLFGYARKDLSGAAHDIVVPDRFRKRHLEDRKQYMSAPHVRRMGTGLELYGRRKDGTEFPVDISLGPLQAKEEIVTLAVVRDFSGRKQALDETNRLTAYIEFSSDAIIGKTLDGIIVSWNPGAEIIYGYSPEEAIGSSISLLAPPDRPDEMSVIIAKIRRGEAVGHTETVRLRKDGTPIDVSLSVSPVKDSFGNIVGAVTIARDITEHKRMQKHLEEYQMHLEEMVKERTAELEIKSISLQELNTALKVLLKQREDDKKAIEERFVMNVKNLVLPYVGQIRKGRLDAGQRAYLDVMEAHLNEITTPLLQTVRQFNLTPKEIKVAALIRQGKSTKEIAEVLGIASGSIDVHRRNIRRKLGLTNRKANLLSHLESLDE